MLGAALVAGSVLGVPTVASAEAPESADTVVGELVQAWPEFAEPADAAEHADERPLSWIATAAGDAVRVPTEAIEDVARAEVGATVSVTVGDEVVDAASEAGIDPARELLRATVVSAAPSDPAPAVAAAGTVTDQVTVVMVVPSGTEADTRTLADVVDAVNGPAAAFWSEQSDGAVRIGVTASLDARTTTLTASCSDAYGIWTEAAQRAGWTPGPGKHLLVYLPVTATDCSYGLAEVGTSLTSGGRLYVRDVVTSVIAHELGHNFGLGHSSELQCNSAIETGTCQVSGYNDWYDVMGYSWDQVGTLNAPQAARLGFLPPAERAVVTATSPSTTYTVVPLSAASGLRAVQITDATGVVYWLEYRQSSGQDSWLASTGTNWPRLQQGVTLRRAAGQPNTSLLLDPTPSAAGGWSSDRQVALTPGVAVPLSDGQFWVAVQSVDALGAVIAVSTPEGERQLRSTTRVSSVRSRTAFWPAESLTSPNGRFQMVFQSDGNLVVYADGGRPVWATRTSAPGGQFVVQGDGNMVVYTASGTPVWASGSNAPGGVRLVLQDDGNLVLYRISGGAVWASGVERDDVLRAGRTLPAGSALTSANGQYRAVMQADGNLVVYRVDGAVRSATRSAGTSPRLVVQTDGNAVIYASAGSVWSSRTTGDASSFLWMQDDGNLVLYRGSGSPMWWPR